MKQQVQYLCSMLNLFTYSAIIFDNKNKPVNNKLTVLHEEINHTTLNMGQNDQVCMIQTFISNDKSKLVCWDHHGTIELSPEISEHSDQFDIGYDHICVENTELGFKCSYQTNPNQPTIKAIIPDSLSHPSMMNDTDMIGTGIDHSCAQINFGRMSLGKLKPDHRLNCWGENNFGQTNTPEKLDLTKQMVVGMAIGPFANCLLISYFYNMRSINPMRSNIICWGGLRTNDQDNHQQVEDIPIELETDGETDVEYQISVGFNCTCVSKMLEMSIQVSCWGPCPQGMADVPQESQSSQFLAVGHHHVCGIVSTTSQNQFGKVNCWGSSINGEVMVPDQFDNHTLVVAAGNTQSCALKANQYVGCWGSNTYIPSSIAEFTRQISVGGRNTCTQKTGELKCYGNMEFGQLNVPSTQVHSSVQHSLGFDFNCSSNLDERIDCWGFNFRGQTDIPDAVHALTKNILDVEYSNFENRNEVVDLKLGLDHSCASVSNRNRDLPRSVQCWGKNYDGQLDVPVNIGKEQVQLSVGDEHSCAYSIREYKCYTSRGCMIEPIGPLLHDTNENDQFNYSIINDKHNKNYNYKNRLKFYGEYGNPSSEPHPPNPVKISCWGSNEFAQIDLPPEITKYSDLEQLASGGAHMCALNNWVVRCWGSDSHGQLQMPNLPQMQAHSVAAGVAHSCAIREGQVLTCWGLGGGAGTGMQAIMVATGWEHDCIVTQDGRDHCWGANDYGQSSKGRGVSELEMK